MQNLPKLNLPLILFLVFFILPLFGRYAWIIILIIVIYILIQKLLTNHPNILEHLNIFGEKKHMSEVINVKEQIFGQMAKRTKNLFILIIGAILLVILLANSIIIVEAGFTGVYSLFGKVKEEEIKSGLHLVNPFAKIIPMTIRTEEYTMSVISGEGKKKGADAIVALTKEGLSVELDITVFYHLNQEDAAYIYEKVGLNYEEKIIRPEIRSSIRAIIAQYEAKDIYSEKRKEASQRIADSLIKKLSPRGIATEDVLLRNVKLPSGLAQAIQEKLQAEQEAEKYDFILDKEKKEADRKRIAAEGQKDAQRIINESLTTNYLYYLYINELKDREGTIYVPTSPNTGMPLFKELGR